MRHALLLSLALSIAIPVTCKAVFAEDAPAAATPAPAAAAPAAAAPAAAPAETPAPAAEKPQLNSSPENLTAPPPEIKPAKKVRKKEVKKANFEQMERHKEDGYYSSMQKPMVDDKQDFEQMKRHDEDGYYKAMPATPKEYHNVTETPKYVPPEPAAVAPPVVRPNYSEPGRKFDDDTGSSGSITYTRHVKTGKEMLAGGHWDLAKKHLKEAIHTQPENPDAYPGYIDACQRGGDWSETLHSVEKYIELVPAKEKEYAWQLGEAQFQLQRYDKAVPQLKKALANGHHQTEIHKMLLRVAQQKADNAEVINEYNALCKLNPKDYKTQLDFAALLERSSKPLDAIAHYRAATDANPTDGRTLGRLAYLIMYHNKDYDGAIAVYNKAMQADPVNAKTYQDGIAYCSQQKQLASQPKKK